MQVDPRIVEELRTMFLNGTTPSRLIRHLASLHESDPAWPDTIEP